MLNQVVCHESMFGCPLLKGGIEEKALTAATPGKDEFSLRNQFPVPHLHAHM